MASLNSIRDKYALSEQSAKLYQYIASRKGVTAAQIRNHFKRDIAVKVAVYRLRRALPKSVKVLWSQQSGYTIKG